MVSPEEQAKIDAALDAALEELDSDEEDEAVPPSALEEMPSDHQLFTSMLRQMLDDGTGIETNSDLTSGFNENEILGRFMQDIQLRLTQVDMDDPSERSETTETKKTPTASDEKAVQSVISDLMQGLSQQVQLNEDEDGMDDMPDMDDPEMVHRFMENIMGTSGSMDPSSPEFNADAVIDGMMEQLLCKDLMYEPIKQVAEKFPQWLEEKRSSLSPEEFAMRSKQSACFARVVQVYETEPNNFAKLMELMQEVQEYGQPPSEIIREIAPDIELDANGVPKMGEGDFMGGIPNMGQEECRIM